MMILLLIKSTAALLLINRVLSESVCPSVRSQSTVCVGSTISNTFVVTRLNMCSFWYRQTVGTVCVIIYRVKTGHWKGSCRDPCWLNPAPYLASPSLPQSQGSISRISSGGVHFAGRPCRLPPATWRPVRCHLQVNCHQTAFLLMSTNSDFFFFLQICLSFLFILTHQVLSEFCCVKALIDKDV